MDCDSSNVAEINLIPLFATNAETNSAKKKKEEKKIPKKQVTH